MLTKTNNVIICVKKNSEARHGILAWLNDHYAKELVVKVASNADEAMSIMGQVSMNGLNPAIFVCDAVYDDMNGDELIKIILQLFPHVITVMFAEDREQDIVLKTLNESGLFAYIKTPCSEQSFIETIDRAIDEYHFHLDVRRQSEKLEAEVNERTEALNNIMNDLKSAQEIAHVGNWNWDIGKNIIEWSNEAYNLLGVSPINFSSSIEAFIDLLHVEDRQNVKNAIKLALTSDLKYDVYSKLTKKSNNKECTLRHKGTVRRNEYGEAISMFGTIHDVTDIMRTEKQLSSYKEIIDKYVIVSSTDLYGNITDVSDAFCMLSGYSRLELIGVNHNILRHPDMKPEVFANMWRTIKAGKTWQGEIKNRKKDGGFYWVHAHISPYFDNMHITGFIAIRTDITAQKRIEEISILDELTGLYNRRYFNQVFDRELNRARRESKNFVFVMADIDNFKKYNDTYGHSAGDDVLKKISNVLKDTLMRSGDTAFRLGGEEFGAILTVTHIEDVQMLTEKIKNALIGLNIEHIKNEHYGIVTASFGVKIVKEPYEEMQDIYKVADDALYTAKDSGRNCIVIV